MKQQKKTRRQQYGDTFKPKGKSKYASKKRGQMRGHFNSTSPFVVEHGEVGQ